MGLYIPYAESSSISARHNQQSVIAINQKFPPWAYIFRPWAYIFRTQSHLPSLRDTISNQSFLSIPVKLLSVYPRPEPLRAQRSGEQASGTRRLTSRHLLGCCGQSGFWGASSATARRRDHLLSLRRIGIEIGFIFFLVDTFGTATTSSSWWTFAGLHCQPLPAPTEVHYFEQHTMSTSVNGAASAFGSGPSSRYNPNQLSFIFSMSAVVFATFISNLSSDKIAHVHLYATTILCVIFWIKSNIKCLNF